ncbi:cation transporter [Piscinibacter koreensis]|uniref:Cation transporter n=1 Tax=Piscinibacter koreensis TaxID=2742824 RepID=A0A7Y6NSC5_9BURK|nr:cation transporter [Schlegelella koreensis]NUZ08398.1 cation transporter [Schlegelella koreensis]
MSGSDDDDVELDASRSEDRHILWLVLLINLGQCLIGVLVGLWASSTAVIGAALDNLADASVYGVSLYAIGRAPAIKVRAARLSGWLLILLAVMLLVEVLRRFFGGEAPVGPAMMAMAAVNAALNIVCLRLLKRHRGEDVNFKASAIFTNNDSIVNLAIVLSGALVIWLGSNLPDLILGLVVSAIAVNGGREILTEAREAGEKAESGAA